MTQPTLAQAALLYGHGGWPVFPLHQVDADAACSCKLGPDRRQPGKHPRIPSGFHAATCNPDRVRAWWARWPHANIGIATGATGLPPAVPAPSPSLSSLGRRRAPVELGSSRCWRRSRP